MTGSSIRILCVDDHTVVQKGLTAILDGQPDMEVVAYAASGDEAVTMYRDHRPHITLMDLHLPGMSGFEAIRVIRNDDPNARIIVLTMYQGEADVARALKAGAEAYLLKSTPASEIIEMIRVVNAGGRGALPSAMTRNPTGERPMTAREEDVLQLIAKGYRNKEIAAALHISEDTVLTHTKSIFIKLGVHDRTEAVANAVRLGIVHID